MKKVIQYLAIGMGIIVICGAGAWIQATLASYHNVNWFKPGGRTVYFGKYEFANYRVPETYNLVTYRHDERFRHGLLLYENKVTGQLLVLTVLKGFPKVDPVKIKTDSATPKRPLWKAIRYPLSYENHSFSILHYMPFGWRDDYENSGNDLTLKGIRVVHEEQFETEVAQVKWLEGEFERVEFKKTSGSWQPYLSTVLDFAKPMYGAIAVLNEKKTGLTTFAIGANTNMENFNEKEFRDIVESITFDTISSAKVEEEFGQELKRLQEEIKDTRQLEKALQEYLDNY